MAKSFIPEELEQFIKVCLTDGVLTAKERQAIHRKAELMHVDYDEVDIYLDSLEQQLEQDADAVERKKKGKLCPFCDNPVPQLAEKCPHCDATLTPEATQELQEILDKLEDSLVDFKSGKDFEESKAKVERFIRKAKMFYGNNPKIQKLLAEVETETINAEKRAKAAARNATISNAASSVSHGFVATIKYFALEHKKLMGFLFFILICIPACNWMNDNILNPESDYDKRMKEEIEESKQRQEEQEAEIKEFNDKVVRLINSGDLDEANSELTSLTPPSSLYSNSDRKDAYDATYMKACKAYIKNNDFDGAEEIGLAFRAVIGHDYYWKESSTYSYLKSAFKKAGVDFSALGDEDED